MDINFSKRSESFPDITLYGEVVKKVQSTKLLGVYLSDDLKWDCHIKKYMKKQQSVFSSYIFWNKLG